MKALVCEMCNSNDLIKQDGMYVCQHCGTKYTVEDAKKLMVDVSGSAVKIDKSDEIDKLLVLARRAREDNNSENAEKYYSMVLQEDPNNWEAAFFQVYYQALQSKLINFSNAALSVTNSIDRTMKIISNISDKTERDGALDTVIAYSQSIAATFSSVAISQFRKNSSEKGSRTECRNRVAAAKSIHQMLENSLKKYFPSESDRLVNVQKAENSFISSNGEFFLPDYRTPEITRLTNEIRSKDGNYKQPTVNSGCYVATAVYGSYDCPQVWTLRRYRDNTLAKTWYGRAFIHTYYAISPTLVKWFGNTDWFRNMWKPKLDKMVSNLNSEGVENTPYEDKKW